jgi:hypothetical protein
MKLWSNEEWAARIKGKARDEFIALLAVAGYECRGITNGRPVCDADPVTLQRIALRALGQTEASRDFLDEAAKSPSTIPPPLPDSPTTSPPDLFRQSGAEPPVITPQTAPASKPWKRKQKKEVCEGRFRKHGYNLVGWDKNRPIFDGPVDEDLVRRRMVSGG